MYEYITVNCDEAKQETCKLESHTAIAHNQQTLLEGEPRVEHFGKKRFEGNGDGDGDVDVDEDSSLVSKTPKSKALPNKNRSNESEDSPTKRLNSPICGVKIVFRGSFSSNSGF